MTPEEHRREAEVCRKAGLHELAQRQELLATTMEQEAIAAKHNKPSPSSPLAFPQGTDTWSGWFIRSFLAAVVVLGVGMFPFLGLLPVVFVGPLAAICKAPLRDAAWPLGIGETFIAALLVIPVSLILRYLTPHIAGWRHVLCTALWVVAAIFVLSAYIVCVDLPDQEHRLRQHQEQLQR